MVPVVREDLRIHHDGKSIDIVPTQKNPQQSKIWMDVRLLHLKHEPPTAPWNDAAIGACTPFWQSHLLIEYFAPRTFGIFLAIKGGVSCMALMK